MAALTTSIPETIGEVHLRDYRFCWIRDASMSIETLIELGHRNSEAVCIFCEGYIEV